MRVLLDTHALLWWVTGDPRLSETGQLLLASPETDIFVSAVSAWEVTTKVRLNKLPGAEAFARDFSANIARLGFWGLAISVSHGQRAGTLPGHHKDPFDRMLIAQSLSENLPLVSNELIFEQYGVQRIW